MIEEWCSWFRDGQGMDKEWLHFGYQMAQILFSRSCRWVLFGDQTETVLKQSPLILLARRTLMSSYLNITEFSRILMEFIVLASRVAHFDAKPITKPLCLGLLLPLSKSQWQYGVFPSTLKVLWFYHSLGKFAMPRNYQGKCLSMLKLNDWIVILLTPLVTLRMSPIFLYFTAPFTASPKPRIHSTTARNHWKIWFFTVSIFVTVIRESNQVFILSLWQYRSTVCFGMILTGLNIHLSSLPCFYFVVWRVCMSIVLFLFACMFLVVNMCPEHW